MKDATHVLLLGDLPEGRRVKVARIVQDLRQVDVAAHANVSVNLVGALERGWRVNEKARRAILAVVGLE